MTTLTEDIIFTPDGNRIWVAVTDKGKISVNVLADKVKIYVTQEESFDDLLDALSFISTLTNKRPLFEMDEATANSPTR